MFLQSSRGSAVQPNETRQDTLIVDSSERFAVIGPGNPYPELLASSKHSFSDLVGYYSLREAGLGSLLSDRYSRPSDPFTILAKSLWPRLALPREKRSGIFSIDFWYEGEAARSDDNRKALYSLVFDVPIEALPRRYGGQDVSGALEGRLRDIVVAYRNGDALRAKYNAELIATILSLTKARVDEFAKITEVREKLFQQIWWIYLATGVMVGTYFVLRYLQGAI